MKTILLGMAAVTALGLGAPAAAQYANGGYQNQGYQNNVGANATMAARIERLRLRIQAGVQSGAITRAEAQPLRQQLRALTQLERQYSVGGLTGQERSDLQQRFRSLRQQIRVADGGAQGRYDRDDDDYGQNRDGRDGRYDRDDDDYGRTQDGRDGRYDRAYDRNNDGFDDRDYDRDGRWDDDARNGANNDDYERPAARGGLGGIIDNVLGRGSLRVGQRASGNLSALPYEYRNQYRDTNSAYYRTDGRQIYQIDARTQTVVRVYAMNR